MRDCTSLGDIDEELKIGNEYDLAYNRARFRSARFRTARSPMKISTVFTDWPTILENATDAVRVFRFDYTRRWRLEPNDAVYCFLKHERESFLKMLMNSDDSINHKSA